MPTHYLFIDPERMKTWVGPVGWPVAYRLHTTVVTHQLQVKHRTVTACQLETDVLPLCHATNQWYYSKQIRNLLSNAYRICPNHVNGYIILSPLLDLFQLNNNRATVITCICAQRLLWICMSACDVFLPDSLLPTYIWI